MFAGDRLLSKVKLAAEYISTAVCTGFDIKVSNNL